MALVFRPVALYPVKSPIHGELEQAIADWIGVERSILMVGGHATNETTIGHLVGPGDLIIHDSLAHTQHRPRGVAVGGATPAFPAQRL